MKRMLHSAAWVSLHTGLYRVITLLIAVMAARLLNVEEYGQVALLQSTAALFIMLATMGLGTVATKLVAEQGNTHIYAISRINLAFCLLSACVVFFFKGVIAEHIYQDASLAPLMGGLSIYILFCGITQVQTGILAGVENYRTIAQVNLLSGLFAAAAVFAGIQTLSVAGWVIALIAAEILKVLLLQRAIQHSLGDAENKLFDIERVLKPAVPIALSGFFILPVNWLLIRELLLSEGYLDVALMNIADQWIAILTFFPIALGNAMLPIMARMQSAEHRAGASNQALLLNVGCALALAIPVALLSKWVLLLYGAEYAQHSHIFWYVVPLVVVLSMTNQMNNRVIANDQANAMLWSNVLWMILSLPLTMVFLGLEYGIVGLLLGRLCGYVGKLLYLLHVSSQTSTV